MKHIHTYKQTYKVKLIKQKGKINLKNIQKQLYVRLCAFWFRGSVNAFVLCMCVYMCVTVYWCAYAGMQCYCWPQFSSSIAVAAGLGVNFRAMLIFYCVFFFFWL